MASSTALMEDRMERSPNSGSPPGNSLEGQLESFSLLPHKTEEENEETAQTATPGVSDILSVRGETSENTPMGTSGQSKKGIVDMLYNNRPKELETRPRYIDAHPEARLVLQAFFSAVLAEEPEDVYAFARQYFQRVKVPKEELLRPLVICGPSGVGKGTLMNMLFEEFGGYFGFSVSHTTRAPRPGEVEGVHYNFTSRDAMEAAIEEGRFLEFARVHTNLYGTSLEAVRQVQRAGKVCVLDIDVQGVMKVKETDVNPHYVFIAPPSVEHLEARLRGRGTESAKDIETRLGAARAEIDYGLAKGNFEHVVVNDTLEKAYADLKTTLVGFYSHLAAKTA
ncbi:hypothetical protein NSK_004469 [Nannochloropsis salina CCMP1776]|uniref:guanylate kinase n=1 Tax=Nannochloropsis salina CCMP1776 TaxID=1027361 RepID=A0A4D9D0R1_9STRA|nr:hypothetical protein NSK_004469 [Nannochloropsis salina CCMP1776]|eukprot:TFJ84484.1 hypothetical protein NSK_004469 [Nannochloropsis salina CCMP1776]